MIKYFKRLYNVTIDSFHKLNKETLKESKKTEIFIKILSILFISIFLTCISFLYTSANLDIEMYKSYFSPLLFLLNFLPILILIILLSFIFKRVHISFLITSIFIMILGIANQTKVVYRDDIVKFMDFSLITEAMTMAQRYSIVIKKYTIISIILIIIIYFILRKYVPKFKMKIIKQLSLVILTLCTMIFGFKTLYSNSEIYENVGDQSLINIWITTRQYQIRGLIYPFVYTIMDGVVLEPEGYDENLAKDILNNYEYENIEEDKKVNIIAIMLEAYNDFSKFNKINFTEDIYENFHEIQDKSISGTLITSIFGGGTIVTERNFLTGYYNSPNYRKKTNSYVWYFKEQGYRTEAMHPVFGAFYNRASVNPNLGFDKYYHYDNTYSKIQSDFMNDNIFFDYIISGFEKSKNKGIPYFNFSVTYQNHGPYLTEPYETPYFVNEGYSEEAYNTLNWYFHGIKQTNEALKKLINYFEKEEEPTIVILFGDHNPYLGENALAYNELGINIDMNNIEGFVNYYETPYIIYGNNSAKQIFNKSFVGKGNTISPIFLMNELFDYCELKGNEYLQYMSDLKKQVDVINNEYRKENNSFVKTSDSEYNNLIEEYKYINYFYGKNYMNGSK